MKVDGFALMQDNRVVAHWTVVPGRIDLPGGDVVMGADATWANEQFKIVPYSWTEPDPEPVRALVLKSVIVDRLQAAGKLEAARAALDAQDLYTRERWNTRDSIYADDPTALGLLQAIGADPAAIMAP